MEEIVRTLLIYVGIPGIIGLFSLFIKNILADIKELQKQIQTKVSEKDVRIIIADKIDPIREDIQDLKNKVDKLIDLLLTRK